MLETQFDIINKGENFTCSLCGELSSSYQRCLQLLRAVLSCGEYETATFSERRGGGRRCWVCARGQSPYTSFTHRQQAGGPSSPNETPVGIWSPVAVREEAGDKEKEEVPEACLLFLLFVSPQIHQSWGEAGWGGPGRWPSWRCSGGKWHVFITKALYKSLLIIYTQ